MILDGHDVNPVWLMRKWHWAPAPGKQHAFQPGYPAFALGDFRDALAAKGHIVPMVRLDPRVAS
ncbi:hypothetical protein [Xanthomonas oryzae]|nr:hypothetical protein [Xanthomonas oryzae]